MRRGGVAGLVASAMALALAGCSTGPTVGDGAIGVDWAQLPEPVVATPLSGVCTSGDVERARWFQPTWSSDSEVECTAEHASEIFHVGTLAVGDGGSEPPELGSEPYREAYAECAEEADDFLGGDYRTARVFLLPTLPTGRQWAGGARWFGCQLMEIKNSTRIVVARQGTLRDGLRGAGPAAITCANELLSDDETLVLDITFVSCTTRHDTELTGIYTAPDGTYPGHEKLHEQSLDACFGIGAKYLGMSRAGLDSVGGVTWMAWHAGEEGWSAGHRGSWCFMGEYPHRKLRGSIKNRRPGSFPH